MANKTTDPDLEVARFRLGDTVVHDVVPEEGTDELRVSFADDRWVTIFRHGSMWFVDIWFTDDERTTIVGYLAGTDLDTQCKRVAGLFQRGQT